MSYARYFNKEEEMKKYIDYDFIHNLNKFIMRSGKTKTIIAKEIGTSRQALSNYLSGKNFPTSQTFEKICNVLKCTKAELFEKNKK